MESYRSLSLPLSQDAVLSLSAGDAVLLSGVLYTCLLYTSPSPRDA